MLTAVKEKDGIVAAPSDGSVGEILVSVGQRTADTAAALLTDAEAECLFRFSITKEEGKYVRLGDPLTLALDAAGGEKCGATADYVSENSAGGYDVTCKLDGMEAPVGSFGTATRTVQGELQNQTVPIDALVSENGADYVFVLKEKMGILGSEYYVERLKVTVTDQNDRYAALESAALGADAAVVVFASKELSQGESVRAEE